MNRFILPLTLFISVILYSTIQTASGDGFSDITEQTGITFQHVDGSSGKYWIVESVASGMGVFDYDNDGDLDLYFLNGAALPGKEYETPPVNTLYRNDGNMKFTDVTEESGAGDMGYALGCAMGDVDKDGNIDIYICNFKQDAFYHNNGDGTFTNITDQVGLDNDKNAVSACFGDYNQDGWLDLYVANYITCPLDKHVACKTLGVPVYCDPSDTKEYEPQISAFYLNNGDGTFRNATDESGIGANLGRGMGIISTDYDNDGDLDIYVANDVMENFIYANNGDATFEEMALFSGIAYDMHGREQGSMAPDFGDFDNDGWFDLVHTNYQNQYNTLYHNEGDGFFKDISIPSGFAQGSVPNVSWACFFMDYDHDMDQDIFVGNGHLQVNIERIDPNIPYNQPNQIYRNNGDSTFTDVSKELGFDSHPATSVRGGAIGDLDNDGDLDIVLSNARTLPTVLRNDMETGNHWINIKLNGKDGVPNGIGARVTVVVNEVSQMNEVRSGSSFQSQYDTRLHFGLGDSNTIDTITVRWQDGHVDTYTSVEADRFIQINKGDESITVIK